MKTVDIQAGSEYSTCDGLMVVAADPVHAHYQRAFDATTDKYVILDLADEGKSTPENPWAKCINAKPQSMHRVGAKGIKVIHYKVDRDGKRIEDTGQEAVLRPQDIVGTWKEYLTLYGHVVRDQADQRERKELIESTLASIRTKTRDAGHEFAVKHSTGWRDDKPHYTISFRVEALSDEDKGYHQLAIQKATEAAAVVSDIVF